MISPRARLRLLHSRLQQIHPRVINRAELSNLTWSHITIALQRRSSESRDLPITCLFDTLADFFGRLVHDVAR